MTAERAPMDGSNPVRRRSSESDYSLMEFMRMFPDDAACLDQLWRDRFAPDGHHAQCPRCERERKFHRTKTRASYTCDSCGLHLHPMKGTIFERSSTSLHLWFYAMYLTASTRCGISAKQMEREIGVTYKQAHKMMKRIRTLMRDDREPLKGDAEIAESSWGGKAARSSPRRAEQPALVLHLAKTPGPQLLPRTGTRMLCLALMVLVSAGVAAANSAPARDGRLLVSVKLCQRLSGKCAFVAAKISVLGIYSRRHGRQVAEAYAPHGHVSFKLAPGRYIPGLASPVPARLRRCLTSEVVVRADKAERGLIWCRIPLAR